MSNKTVFFIIWTIVPLLCVFLARAAAEHDQWRGFLVSATHLLVSGLLLSKVLTAQR